MRWPRQGESIMSLVFLTDRNAVLAAIKDFRKRGRDDFLEHHGYGRARDWFLRQDGLLYDSKAIAGVAAGIQEKGPALHHKAFNGGAVTVVRKLRALGFEVVDVRDPTTRKRAYAQAPSNAPAMWKLVDKVKASEQAFDDWRAALVGDAEPRGVRSFWRPELGLRMTFHDDGRTQLDTEDRATDWAVELNAPGLPGDANRTSGAARDPDGNLWLLRQARLQLKGRHEGSILSDEFLKVTGLEPVPVQVASGPSDRVWLRVCRLDQSEPEVAAETARFVAYCRLVRDQRSPDRLPAKALAFAREVLAGPEVMGFLQARARPAIPAREIWKAQAEVWQALSRRLQSVGRRLDKPRPAPGFEVDGLVKVGRTSVLVEMKTSTSAADVYTGLGQLLLYHRMLVLPKTCKLVLLLPQPPSACLRDTLKTLGVTVALYSVGAGAVGKRIGFEPAFLRMLGLAPAT